MKNLVYLHVFMLDFRNMFYYIFKNIPCKLIGYSDLFQNFDRIHMYYIIFFNLMKTHIQLNI